MSPLALNFFRSIPTTLKLNGPSLEYLTQPIDVVESLVGLATFTGIVSATYPPSPGDIVEGSFEFHWFYEETEIFDTAVDSNSNVDIVSSGNISTCTFSNIPSTDSGKTVSVVTDYIPADGEGNANNDNLRSNLATLTLIPDIVIKKQPESVEVAAGNDAVFNVEAELENGVASELFYQWYVDGVAQTNVTSSGYTYSGTDTDTLTVNVGNNVSIGGPAICISVIDESSPSVSTIASDWNSFRANYPQRPFWLLQPIGYGPDRLKIPSSYDSDPLANAPITVNRDNGNSSQASDWFNMCNLSQAAPGTSISLSIDNSGSTTTSQVQASINLFNSKCQAAGLVIYDVDMIPYERWAVPHNRELPESSNAPDKNIYCEVSNPQAFNSPLNSNTVTMSIVTPRPIIKFESYTFNNQYKSDEINLSTYGTAYTLTRDTFGTDYSIVQFHSTEKNNTITLGLYGSKGNNNGSYNGGQGGVSNISFTVDKDVEHTLIGVADNSSIFLYRGSNLIAVVGEGGDAGTSGDGGAGGGINIPGEDGGGRLGGFGGERINSGTLSLSGSYGSVYETSDIALYSGDSVAQSPDGGRTISCTKGSYWIDQGIAACSDNSPSEIKFVNVDGTTIDSSSNIIRGFKPGYTISNTLGLEINNGGRGGNGATGGGGGTSGSGGGGGSGYTSGLVTINDTKLGGNSNNASFVVFSIPSDSTMTEWRVIRSSTYSNIISFLRQSGQGPNSISFGPNSATVFHEISQGAHYMLSGITVNGNTFRTDQLRLSNNDTTLGFDDSGAGWGTEKEYSDLMITCKQGKFINTHNWYYT